MWWSGEPFVDELFLGVGDGLVFEEKVEDCAGLGRVACGTLGVEHDGQGAEGPGVGVCQLCDFFKGEAEAELVLHGFDCPCAVVDWIVDWIVGPSEENTVVDVEAAGTGAPPG